MKAPLSNRAAGIGHVSPFPAVVRAPFIERWRWSPHLCQNAVLMVDSVKPASVGAAEEVTGSLLLVEVEAGTLIERLPQEAVEASAAILTSIVTAITQET